MRLWVLYFMWRKAVQRRRLAEVKAKICYLNFAVMLNAIAEVEKRGPVIAILVKSKDDARELEFWRRSSVRLLRISRNQKPFRTNKVGRPT